jgi:hypothetical protein
VVGYFGHAVQTATIELLPMWGAEDDVDYGTQAI